MVAEFKAFFGPLVLQGFEFALHLQFCYGGGVHGANGLFVGLKVIGEKSLDREVGGRGQCFTHAQEYAAPVSRLCNGGRAWG